MLKILLLTGDAGEAQEIYYAKYRLEEEGWTVHIVNTTKRTFLSVVHDFDPGILLVKLLILGPPLPWNAVGQFRDLLRHGTAIVE